MKLTSNFCIAHSFLISIHPRWPRLAELQALLNPMASGVAVPCRKREGMGMGRWAVQRTLLLSFQKSVLFLLLRKPSDLLPIDSPLLKHACLKPGVAPFCTGVSVFCGFAFFWQTTKIAWLCTPLLGVVTILYCTTVHLQKDVMRERASVHWSNVIRLQNALTVLAKKKAFLIFLARP